MKQSEKKPMLLNLTTYYHLYIHHILTTLFDIKFSYTLCAFTDCKLHHNFYLFGAYVLR